MQPGNTDGRLRTLLSLCPWGGADILPPNSANTAKSPPPPRLAPAAPYTTCAALRSLSSVDCVERLFSKYLHLLHISYVFAKRAENLGVDRDPNHSNQCCAF